ncbi:MAG: putative ABC transporter permease [Coriobacteriia bacterium]|nr:putative ABC transporter permease [Coriobacteriia bacterium]
MAEAKEEKQYDPNKLGFMRVLMVLWVINILATLMSLVMLKKGQWDLGFVGWRNLFNVVLEGVTLWLLWQRKAIARYAIMAFAGFTIVVGTTYTLVSGHYTVTSLALNSAFDVVLILYFALSPRAKAVLNQPFSSEIAASKQVEYDELNKWRTWPFWRNMIMYYCVFSVAGHWMEAAFCLLVKYGIFPGVYDPTSQIWSDYLYPFPVYGVGFCFCVLLFHPVKQWLRRRFKGLLAPLVLSYVFNAVVCALIELALGLATNMPATPGGPLPLWDYSDMPFNFMGQICLLYSSAFGVAATFVTWVAYPAIAKLLNRAPKDGMNVMFAGVAVGYAMLIALYMVNPELPQLGGDDGELVSSVVYVEVGADGSTSTYTVLNPSQELTDAVKDQAGVPVVTEVEQE